MTQETFTLENSVEEVHEIVEECISSINGRIISINNHEFNWEFENNKQAIKCKTLIFSNISKTKIRTTASDKGKNKTFERGAIDELHSSIKESPKIVLYIPEKKMVKKNNPNKKGFEKWLVGAFIGVMVVSFLIVYLSDTPLKKYNCEIISTEVLMTHKKSINIRVPVELNELELKEIATYLRRQNKEFENLFILYYLPGMTVGSGAWATSHYNPYLTINTNSFLQSFENEERNSYKKEYEVDDKSEIENKQSANNTKGASSKNSRKSSDNNINTFGIWIDLDLDLFVRIRKDKNDLYAFEYINTINSPPRNLASILKKTKENGKTVFIDTDPYKKYLKQKFIIEKNGELSIYDKLGLVNTYKKAVY